MALSGSLREFHLSEIVQLLSGQRKTGCLTLTRGAERVHLYFREGRLTGVRDPGLAPNDPLMAFLRRTRWLSDEQLRGVESLHAESGRDVLDILLNGRYIDTEDLSALYERMTIDLLFRLLSWEDAEYSFLAGPPPESALPVSFTTDGLLMEAVRRVDEHRRYLRELPEAHEIPGLRELPDPDAPLSEEEKEIFALVDGNRTVAEIVAEAPLCDFEALEGLASLFENRWLEVVGSREIGGSRIEHKKTVEAAPVRKPTPQWGVAVGLTFVVLAALAAWQPLRYRPSGEAISPERDPHQRARLDDVRAALAVYRHEHGHYPTSLDELVRSEWLQPGQLRFPGHTLRYELTEGGRQYLLDAEPEQDS
jgi:hypothetical protein